MTAYPATVSPAFAIRPAAPADAPAIAHVHVTGWRETYAGLMPEDFLARMTADAARERRTANWTAAANDPAQVVLVAEEQGQIAAFASGGPARDHPGVDAELYALYALNAVHGQAIGRALLSALAQELKARGSRSLALWVLDANPARGWYARRGGREDGEKVVPLPGGGDLREVRLVWDNWPGTT